MQRIENQSVVLTAKKLTVSSTYALKIMEYSAVITQADNSNSFSRFVLSYFITVKHKQGSKQIFLAVHNIRRKGNKLDRPKVTVNFTLQLTILKVLTEIFEEAIYKICFILDEGTPAQCFDISYSSDEKQKKKTS